MTIAQRIPALIVWALLLACLVHGPRSARTPRLWLVIIGAQFATNTWGQLSDFALSFWPCLAWQTAAQVLDLLLLAAFARSLPGRTAALWRLLLAIVACGIMMATLAPDGYGTLDFPHLAMILLRVDIVLALGYLASIGLLLWHRRPIDHLNSAILVGVAGLRVLHALAMWCWFAPGLVRLANLFPLAEIAIIGWWVVEVWPRPKSRALTPAGALT